MHINPSCVLVFTQSSSTLNPLPDFVCVFWAVDKKKKSENLVLIPNEGGPPKKKKRPWSDVIESRGLFAQRLTRLMWINWTRHRPGSLFRRESFLPSEETEWRPEATPRSWVQFMAGPVSGACMRVRIYIYEVLLGSQGGSHPSTKLCFGGRLALTCTAGSWHTRLY